MFLFLLTQLTFAEPVRVAIVDTGYHASSGLKLCPNGLIDLTNTDMTDEHGHGVNINEIIATRLKDYNYCAYVFKVYSQRNPVHRKYVDAFRIMQKMKIDYVNFSSSGRGVDLEEAALVEALLIKGVVFVGAAGNDSRNLDNHCDVYPACYNGVISVGNLNDKNTVHYTSNYGKVIKAWEKGVAVSAGGLTLTGTSQATAIHTAHLIKKRLNKQREEFYGKIRDQGRKERNYCN